MDHLYIFLALIILGALCGPKTLLHTLAVAIDMLIQGLGWNDPVSVTISSRAGLAARNGNTIWAKIICTIFFNPNHCEEAIQSDIDRANEALTILNNSTKGN